MRSHSGCPAGRVGDLRPVVLLACEQLGARLVIDIAAPFKVGEGQPSLGGLEESLDVPNPSVETLRRQIAYQRSQPCTANSRQAQVMLEQDCAGKPFVAGKELVAAVSTKRDLDVVLRLLAK